MTTWWHSDPGVLSSLYYIIWVVNAHYCIIIGELSSQYDITWDFISASSAHEFWRSYTRGRSDIKHIACTSCIQLLCFVFRCNTRELTGDGTEVLTGTWLDRGKLLPGLFFLLLLLLLVPPPLMVLPPDILRFRRLFGGCLDGSAKGKVIGCHRSIKCLCELCGCVTICVCGSPTWWCHHPLPFLEQAGLEAVSGAEAVCLVSGHQLLHWLQNHTQLEEGTKRSGELEITHCWRSYTLHLYQLFFQTNPETGWYNQQTTKHNSYIMVALAPRLRYLKSFMSQQSLKEREGDHGRTRKDTGENWHLLLVDNSTRYPAGMEECHLVTLDTQAGDGGQPTVLRVKSCRN